jgi:hypothetical protein
MVGTATPVLDTITMASTSSGAMPAASSADSTAPPPEFDGNLDVGSVRFGEASQSGVPRQR